MKIHDIEVNIEDLSKSEKKIANFFCKNIKSIPSMTLKDLAQNIEVSIATISRFCKSLGFVGFKDFKNHLKKSFEITPADKMKSILKEIDEDKITPSILNKSINYLKNTHAQLSEEEFNQAVNALIAAKNIYLFAPGPSSGIAELLSYRLQRFHLNIHKMKPSGKGLLESLINLTSEDVIVIFGFFNFSPEIKIILDYAKKINFTTILITDLVVSKMIDQSDIVLYVERGELWNFHSMVAPIAIIESLVVGIAMSNEEKFLDKLNNLHKLRKEYSEYLPK
ncbi:MurR/RpiR family transcriptional regulator [Halanaerocella petrolearia]